MTFDTGRIAARALHWRHESTTDRERREDVRIPPRARWRFARAAAMRGSGVARSERRGEIDAGADDHGTRTAGQRLRHDFRQGRAGWHTNARADVGVVPQEIALYPNLSSHENLTVFGRYLGLNGKALDDAIARALDWAALSDRKSEPVKSFSGGMKRRLNMAVGVLHRPRVLLLDEPTVGVDPQSRERIYQMIESLRADGVSIIYTTHYMEEAERLCDRIAVIDSGRVIATGTKDELVRNTIGTKREVVVEFADGSRVTHLIDDAAEMLRVMRDAETQGSAVRDLTMKSPSLEKVFLHLTGKGLRA